MKLTRALAAVSAAVVLGAGSLVAGGPAAATVTKATTTTLVLNSYSGSTGYGDYVSLDADVAATDGSTVYQGTVTIKSRPIGGTTWTDIYTSPYAGAIHGFELSESAEYQAVYNGYTATSTYQDTYTASASPIVTVNVERGYRYVEVSSKKGCYEVGPLSAPYKKKPVTVSYKYGKSKKFRSSYTWRTDNKSRYCFKLTKTKAPKKAPKIKGPKLKAVKTVFVKSGGMDKHVDIWNIAS